jgi:hypothetical protein
MRFLANENFPGAAVSAVKSAGHDIVWVRTAAPGTSDPKVLAWAARDARILLTFDKDFGELARAAALPASCGVVLFRILMPSPAMPGRGSLSWSMHVSIGPDTFPSSSPAACG